VYQLDVIDFSDIVIVRTCLTESSIVYIRIWLQNLFNGLKKGNFSGKICISLMDKMHEQNSFPV